MGHKTWAYIIFLLLISDRFYTVTDMAIVLCD